MKIGNNMFTARDCFIAFLFVLFVAPEEILSQFEDVRCRCICPEAGKLGIRLKNDEDRRIFLNTTVNPKNCSADPVVRNSIEGQNYSNSVMEIFLERCL